MRACVMVHKIFPTQGTIDARFVVSFPSAMEEPESPAFELNVDLSLPGRGITAIYGQSGSGKTTLLRCIAGLQRARGGVLVVNGEVWQNQQIFRPTHKRALGMVFQESSLFEHLSAYGNLAYAIKRAKNPDSEAVFARVLAMMDIKPLLHRYPQQLSGGERQRIAIARALLINPCLLLMDEPLASLDFARKQEIMPYLERLREELEIPILYISHSIDEVSRLADHLLVLAQGKVAANGALTEVLSRCDLTLNLGDDTGVVLQATAVERDAQHHLLRATFAGGELWIKDSGEAMGQPLRIRVLAKDLSLALENHDDTSILNRLQATIIDVIPDADPAMLLVRLNIGEAVVIARLTLRSQQHLKLSVGDKVWAQIKSVAIVR